MVQRELIRPHSYKLGLLFRLSDILLIVAALWAGTVFRDIPFSVEYLLAGMIGGLFFSIIASVRHLYSSWRVGCIRQEIFRVWAVWFAACAILLVFSFSTKTTALYSRIAVSTWFVITPVFLSLWRLLVRWSLRSFRRSGRNTRTAVIAGAGVLGKQVAEAIMDEPELGIIVKGFYDDKLQRGTMVLKSSNLTVLGNLNDMVADARKGGVDMVYFSLPMRAAERLKQVVAELTDAVSSVYLVPDFFMFDLIQSHWVSIGGFPAVSLFESPFLGATGWLKRVEDIIISIVALVIAGLPMLVIAMIIKWTSPGPILFKQRRYGLDGREIYVWKFRTMAVCEDGAVVSQACIDDQRVTPVGRFLRRTSLDELPQFINVLQGRMSVVGPRPHAVSHNEQYRSLIQGYMRRHKVRPGITGWAQVNGWRGQTETLLKMAKRIEFDMDYIKKWSIWLDLKIIFKTAWIVLQRKGAY